MKCQTGWNALLRNEGSFFEHAFVAYAYGAIYVAGVALDAFPELPYPEIQPLLGSRGNEAQCELIGIDSPVSFAEIYRAGNGIAAPAKRDLIFTARKAYSDNSIII